MTAGLPHQTGWLRHGVPQATTRPTQSQSHAGAELKLRPLLPRISAEPEGAARFSEERRSRRSAGIGDYAAKLEKARKEGRGTEPAQVNRLHPSSATNLRTDENGERSIGPKDEIYPRDQDMDNTDEWQTFGDLSGEPFADEGFDDEDVAEDIPADPYGFNANIQQFMDDPGSTSMQFRDVPEAAESFRRASGSLAGDLDDSGFNAQKRGNRRPANTAAGSGQNWQPGRGLEDVLQQQKGRLRPSSNSAGGRNSLKKQGSEATWGRTSASQGSTAFDRQGRRGDWGTGDDWAAGASDAAPQWVDKSDEMPQRLQSRPSEDSLVPRRGRPPPGRQRISKSRQGVSGSFEGSGQGAKDPGLGSSWYSGPDDDLDWDNEGPGGRRWRSSSSPRGGDREKFAPPDAQSFDSEDPERFARELRPRQSRLPTGAEENAEPVDFSRLMELAARPSKQQAEERSAKGPASAFYAAADALQARLTIGVEGERQQAIDAQRRIYARRSIKQLRSAGVVMTDLQGKHSGEIFSDFLWEFHLAPGAALPGAIFEGQDSASGPEEQIPGGVEAEGSDDARQRQHRHAPLPNHAFRKGDPVLLVTPLDDGSLPNFEKFPHLREKHPALEASIHGIGKSFIRVAVTRITHEALQDAGEDRRWRMDKTVQETTVIRQMQAVAMLDKPFAYLEQQEALQAGRKGIDPEDNDTRMTVQNGLDNLEKAESANREAGFYSTDFREGELRIRQILLGIRGREAANLAGGAPGQKSAAAALAERVPYWALAKGFQEEAKRLLLELFVQQTENKLNRSQISAISHSLSATLSLWQGPPGTGKTRTLLGLLETMVGLSKWLKSTHGIALGPILACADTNAATDNILEGLFARGVNVVRLGRPANVREELHDATLECRAQQHPFGRKALEKRGEADKIYQQRRDEAAAFNSRNGWDDIIELDKFRRGQKRLEKQARAQEADARNLMLYAQRQVLQGSAVVTATCAGAGDFDILTTMRFSIVVLDEATQSTEPSTLIPLLRGAESVIMAGDPNQLPPTVISDTGRAAALDQPLFERLQESEIKPKLLDTQYRMHPAIAGFPSEMFYEGKLRSGIKAASRPAPKGFPWPNPDCPVALVESDHGNEHRGVLKAGNLVEVDNLAPGASSYFNLEEARLAVRAFEMLMTAHDAASGAIISPYNGQVKLIRNLVKQSSLKERVVVSSVDGYQGREADVIVFSSVRNNLEGRLGFVTDERRLNVAITRPRRGLVVVGAPLTLSADENWRRWLDWVRDHGGFLAPKALKLSDEERAAGMFDPQVEESDVVVARTDGEEGLSEWQDWDGQSGLEPDDPDEIAVAASDRGAQEFSIASDWYS